MESAEESAQTPVIDWLSRRLAAGIGAPVKRIDTQSAVVLLCGHEAYKIRRAIRLPFLDYSTVDKRRQASCAEIAVNHTAAPDIYVQSLPIAKTDAGYAFSELGEIVEWATRMRRFDEETTLDKLAERGELSEALIADLARAIFKSHARAPRRPAGPALEALRTWNAQNRAAFADDPDLFDPARAAALVEATGAALDDLAPLLLQRGELGLVRRCHGDLHLRNIALIDGKPMPFDAIDFSETIANGDVLYDLAFAAMDLWERGQRRLANRLVNVYLGENGEANYLGLRALPAFMSLRAAIRAKVEAAGRRHQSGDERARGEAAARRYFDFAERFLAPQPARLVAVGGLSGSGKSALARELAAEIGRPPGAAWLSSDIERKHMFAVAETEKLPDAAYEPATKREVYQRIERKAGLALAAGQAALIDATHARAADRTAISELARAANVEFIGLWLEAPLPARLERAASRRLDPSDADERVVRGQRAEPLDEPGWQALDAAGPLGATLAAARAALQRQGGVGAATPPLL